MNVSEQKLKQNIQLQLWVFGTINQNITSIIYTFYILLLNAEDPSQIIRKDSSLMTSVINIVLSIKCETKYR